MSPGDLDADWSSLLEEKRRAIRDQGHHISPEVRDGKTFRKAFEALCKRQKEHRQMHPFQATLGPSQIRITDLAQTVSKSVADLKHLPPGNSLEGLVWGTSFTLIEYGCKAGFPLKDLVDLSASLNKRVPSISKEKLRSFPELKPVQKPLQDIYSIYIDSHLDIISRWRENPTQDRNAMSDNLPEDLAKIGQRFEEARGKHDVMVKQAFQDMEGSKADERQSGLPTLSRHRIEDVIDIQFVPQRELGRGSYGVVNEVSERSTTVLYARKYIQLKGLHIHRPSEDIEREVKNEISVMQKLRHQHIATFLFHIKKDDAYSIFMQPVADCDLRGYLTMCAENGFRSGDIKEIYPWFGCLLDALTYAHKLDIKHQDIKLSNILIKHQKPYLADFGLAKDFAESDESMSRGEELHGTMVYRAPEIKRGQERGRKADVFSLGCVYSEMFTVTQSRSIQEYREARQQYPSTAFRDCLDMVGEWVRSLIREEEEKSKLDEVLMDEILSMMEKDKKIRPTAQKAMNNLKHQRALFCIE